MPYQIASGHNNAAGLTTVTIQPYCPGIGYTFVMDGDSVADIKGDGSTTWVYATLTAAQFDTLLNEFGLDYNTTPSKKVTIRTTVNDNATGHNRNYANYNAVITAPPKPRFEWFQKNIEFTITAMEAL